MLIVTDNVARERKAMEGVLGTSDDCDYHAVCCYNGRHFAIFLKPEALVHEIIAHEVFHMTHRICDFVGGNFDSSHHEHTALLCGHLSNWVYETLDKWKLKVKAETYIPK